MNKRLAMTLSSAAFILATITAFAQDQIAAPGNMLSQQCTEMMEHEGGMMGMEPWGMMGRQMGMMGQNGMHKGLMLKLMLVFMDVNGDGAVSPEEFQAIHARIFKAIDVDKDGKITAKEIDQFLSDAVPAK
jgi:hypothetical protein